MVFWDRRVERVSIPTTLPISCRSNEGSGLLADYWRRIGGCIHSPCERSPRAHPFIQPTVFAQPPPLDDDDLKGRCCFSTHYYDGLTLMDTAWNWFQRRRAWRAKREVCEPRLAVKVGEKAIRASIRDQLGVLKNDCLTILGAYRLGGRDCTPMDMDHKYSYGMSLKKVQG